MTHYLFCRWQKSNKNQKFGFTLVETILTIIIFAFAIVAVMSFILTIYRSQSYSFQQSVAINEARRGIEIMVKEIRAAKTGDDGSYIIEKADDNEFIFYSDIDKDNLVERVRYFLGGSSSGNLSDDCVTFSNGGSCFVTFADFFTDVLESAKVTVSVEGDFGSSNEYAEIYADGISIGDVCKSGCNDCSNFWQGSVTYDITAQAQDNDIQLMADSSSHVNNFCDWQETNHSMKAKFDLSWVESSPVGQTDLQKGVIKPSGWPIQYLPENEKISVISRYVRNTDPIFKYFDKNGNEIVLTPARPEETTLMRVYLKINEDINRSPQDFELESDAQIRNLKVNL